MMRRATTTSGSFSERYVYTADDERIGIIDESDGAIWWRVRGLDGKVLREWTLTYDDDDGTHAWAWSKDYVYRDGTLLASDSPTGPRHFHLDHLGTIRAASAGDGGLVSKHDYFPYGEVAFETNGDEVMQFTGHERDPGTFGAYGDLDYMHARYFIAWRSLCVVLPLLLCCSSHVAREVPAFPEVVSTLAHLGLDPPEVPGPSRCEADTGPMRCSRRCGG